MKLHQYDQCSQPPLESIPKTASEAFEPGEGVVITSGAATKVGATAKPTHVCMTKSLAADTGALQCIRVNPDMEFEAFLTADGSSLVLGSKVTNHTDGIKVTATTSSGVFEITGFATSAQASGDAVYGRYV
jgi:hypothetical protein